MGWLTSSAVAVVFLVGIGWRPAFGQDAGEEVGVFRIYKSITRPPTPPAVIDLARGIYDRIWVHPNVHPLHVTELIIRNIQVEYSDLQAGSSVVGLPDRIETETYQVLNCTSSKQSKKFDVSLTVEVGQEVLLKTVIKHEAALKVDVKFGSIGGSASGSVTVETTNQQVQKFTVKETKSETETREVQPFTEFFLKAERIIRKNRVPFSGVIVVDADTEMEWTTERLRLRERATFKKYYPKPNDREFSLTGDLFNSTASDMKLFYAERKVKNDDPRCAFFAASYKSENIEAQITREFMAIPQLVKQNSLPQGLEFTLLR